MNINHPNKKHNTNREMVSYQSVYRLGVVHILLCNQILEPFQPLRGIDLVYGLGGLILFGIGVIFDADCKPITRTNYYSI